ncbi:MAG TPA: hypothetical protein VLA19_15980 [Herpetosiphonaceae bacterium]|nr:hypothetical protein [Herpetosiphonaceae bacterium]
MIHLGCIALLLCAGLAGALLGFAGGRAQRPPDAPVDDGAIDELRGQLASSQAENTQLRRRAATLEEQLGAVLGRGCIIAVDIRKPR